jgi:hypothetical protein
MVVSDPVWQTAIYSDSYLVQIALNQTKLLLESGEEKLSDEV